MCLAAACSWLGRQQGWHGEAAAVVQCGVQALQHCRQLVGTVMRGLGGATLLLFVQCKGHRDGVVWHVFVGDTLLFAAAALKAGRALVLRTPAIGGLLFA